jgi:ribosomal protein S18 acetylase RimI-like enzyme
VADEIQVRAAGLGDEAVLAGLGGIVQELHVRARPDVFKAVDIGGLEDRFKELLSTASARVWMAHVLEAPAGYVLVVEQWRPENVFCHPRRWHEIEQLCVHPSYRRRGVARALVARVVQAAIAENVDEIELNTWSFNEPAQRAFEKLGLTVRNVRFGLRTGAVNGPILDSSTIDPSKKPRD